MTLTNLGGVLREARRPEEAISAHQAALVLFRETSDRHGEGLALYNLGLALWDVRRSEEGITMLQGAAAAFRETGDRQSERLALKNLQTARAASGQRRWSRRR
jgi:hypothetical protein